MSPSEIENWSPYKVFNEHNIHLCLTAQGHVSMCISFYYCCFTAFCATIFNPDHLQFFFFLFFSLIQWMHGSKIASSFAKVEKITPQWSIVITFTQECPGILYRKHRSETIANGASQTEEETLGKCSTCDAQSTLPTSKIRISVCLKIVICLQAYRAKSYKLCQNCMSKQVYKRFRTSGGYGPTLWPCPWR